LGEPDLIRNQEGMAGPYGATAAAAAATDVGSTTLDGWLRDHDIQNITVIGIATDHCVRATDLDAAYAECVGKAVPDLTVGVPETGTDDAFEEMEDAGVLLSDWPGAKAFTG